MGRPISAAVGFVAERVGSEIARTPLCHADRSPVSVPNRPADAPDLHPRSNGITAVRQFLALAVVFFHAWPIGGFGPDPMTTFSGGRLDGGGTLAVAGFFGLSGYLLAESRHRHGRWPFFLRRAKRILPGYWLAILLTAAIVGWSYIGAAWLPFPAVGDVTWTGWSAHPLPLVNGSLWTLWPEILCYLVVTLLPRRALGVGLGIIAFELVLFAAFDPHAALTSRIGLSPAMAFITGALIALHPRVPLAAGIAAAACFAAFVTVGTVGGHFLIGAALAYTTIWAGSRLRVHWTSDVSYGTYLLAFPVAQVLVSTGAPSLGVAPFAVLTVLTTLPLAWASWVIVERPILNMTLYRRSSTERSARRALSQVRVPASAAGSPQLGDFVGVTMANANAPDSPT